MTLAPKARARAALLLIYILAACLLVYFWRPTYLLSIVVVLVPPSLLNWLWLKEARRRVLFFAAVTTVLFAPPVELMSVLGGAWDVQTILPRLLGHITLENTLFAFLNFFWGLSFYEYFVGGDVPRRLSRRMVALAGLYVALDLLVFGLYFLDPKLVSVSYAWTGMLVLVIPSVLIYRRRPALLAKAVFPTLFFAAVFFIYEYVSLCIGSWWWPGRYLIPAKLCGRTFPIDDVIIWYFLSTPALIAGYEYFAVGDDRPPDKRAGLSDGASVQSTRS